MRNLHKYVKAFLHTRNQACKNEQKQFTDQQKQFQEDRRASLRIYVLLGIKGH